MLGPKQFMAFFGLFDYLGFSDLSMKLSAVDLRENYLRSLTMVETAAGYNTDGKVHHIAVFSDTLCLKQPDSFETEEENIFAFFRYASLLIHNSVLGFSKNLKIPFRGGISFGDYIFETNLPLHNKSKLVTSHIIGKAVVKAYEWEKKQKWIGASINPEDITLITEKHPSLLRNLQNKNYLIEYDIPTAEGPHPSLAVNFLFPRHAKALIDILKQEESKYTGSIALKYRSSRLFIEYLASKNLYLPQQ